MIGLLLRKSFIIGLFVLLLASCWGCGSSEPTPTKAKAKQRKAAKKVKRKGKKEGDKKKEAAALDIQAKPWDYDPSDKWNPFITPPPPVILGSAGDQFDLDHMMLMGVVRGSGMDAAYIRLPDGTDRIVRIGDILGKHGGEVKEIGKDYLIVEERYMDPKRPTDTFIIEKKMNMADTKKGRK
jgi:Tfp pilus assembly protein PilP